MKRRIVVSYEMDWECPETGYAFADLYDDVLEAMAERREETLSSSNAIISDVELCEVV